MNYLLREQRKTVGIKKGFQNPTSGAKDSEMKEDKDEDLHHAKQKGGAAKGEGRGEGITQEDMNKFTYNFIQRNKIPNVFYEDLEPLELIGLSQRSTTTSGFYNGFVVECPTEEKRAEKLRRTAVIKSIMEQIKTLKSTPNYDENELSDLIRKISTIKMEYMTENKFFGGTAQGESKFNYGRDVLKGSYDEKMVLPYRKIELFQFPSLIGELAAGSKSTREYNFVYSGVKRGALMKGGIRLLSLEDHTMDEAMIFEFDIFEQFLLDMFREPVQVKVRFNLLRGLNLAAQSNAIQIKYGLGGYNAMSSANPYPKLQVGDGNNDVNQGVTKAVNDEKSFVEKDLNPNFFKYYELDAFLPADWRLKFMIYNKGQMMFDSMIGERDIDIEDRYYSESFRLRNFTKLKRTEKLNAEVKKLSNQGKSIESKEKQADLFSLNRYYNTVSMEKEEQPVEYCYLTQPGLKNSQGSAEIHIEALNGTELRKFQPAKFDQPKPGKYQIRLIIWEAFEIPLGEKKAVDVVFKVTLDNEGWTVNEMTKETDTHLGSEGYCIYNWRMLFDLNLPCPFPRLKIAAFDFDAFGSDDSIGEVTLQFNNIIPKLISESKYEAPQRKIKLKNTKKGTDAGEVLISLKIIQSSEAASNPVGEGQEEPNTDPFLEKPKIGRGLGDFFKKLNFNFKFSLGMLWLIMKYGGLVGAGLTMFAVLFIKPGLLT